ncbi:MAG: hypothetical protein ACYC2H_00305 [Thermoplasmatota archaeon]
MSEKTRHKQHDQHPHDGVKDPAHPHPGARMPKTPDKGTLGWATLFAAFIAFTVLLLFVLPAEYGIDPTRIGQLTGISKLSGISNELQLGDRATAINKVEPAAPRNDTVVLTLTGLGDDFEYKLHLLANQSLLYSWTATAPVDFDFHGEPDTPSRPGEFSSFEASQGNARSGSFQAPFDGKQGWYFRNVGEGTVTITLQTWGYYDVIGRI